MSSYFKMCQQAPNSDLGHDRDRHMKTVTDNLNNCWEKILD